MKSISQNFSAMRAALLQWAETGDGDAYEEAYDLGRRIAAAAPIDVHEAELQCFTGMLLTVGFTADRPLEIDVACLSEDALNVDYLSVLAERLSSATYSARYLA